MPEKLQILSCEIFRKEFQQLLRAEKWAGQEFEFMALPPSCLLPQLKANVDERLKSNPPVSKDALIFGTCAGSAGQFPEENRQGGFQPMSQCFQFLLNRTLLDYLMAQGAYLVTPSWLETWKQKLEAWGFDQATARDFFHESARKLTLLDTGVDPASASHLDAFGVYLDMPTEIFPVGLDFFELSFTRAVNDHRLLENRQKTEAEKAEYVRQAVDSAMAVDLLIQLTLVHSEKEAIDQILEIFTVLFSPGQIHYYLIEKKEVISPFGTGLDERERQDFVNWAITMDDDYRLASSGEGFYLRLRYQMETVGVLFLRDFHIPGHTGQYLNLSLSIAPLCGLAISNTRLYQKLQEAEKTVRRERDESESIRKVMAELTTHLTMEKVLEQFLLSLSAILPYDYAVIFLLNSENQLLFQKGVQIIPGEKPISYTPPVQIIENGLELINSYPAFLDHLSDCPLTQQYFGGEKIQGCLGTPFSYGEKLRGFLWIGSRQSEVFQRKDAEFIRNIANEASFAMENARLYSEVQALAITDSLTGLFNRRHFYHLAEQEIKRSLRYRHPLSVIMADVDFFKKVNDTYGHSAGDLVLSEVAACFQENIRETDFLGRYGGEEFILMLPESNIESARMFAERVRRIIAERPFPAIGADFHITVSFGVAEFLRESQTLDSLIDCSDRAMYDAKIAGRNRVAVFSAHH